MEATAVAPLTIANANALNLTAYAVRAPQNHYVALANKEHSANAQIATVTIDSLGIAKINGQPLRKAGFSQVKVPAASAAVVKFTLK